MCPIEAKPLNTEDALRLYGINNNGEDIRPGTSVSISGACEVRVLHTDGTVKESAVVVNAAEGNGGWVNPLNKQEPRHRVPAGETLDYKGVHYEGTWPKNHIPTIPNPSY